MTIQTVMLCDECDNIFIPEGPPHGREPVSRQAHADGWASTFRDGKWTNTCPDHNN